MQYYLKVTTDLGQVLSHSEAKTDDTQLEVQAVAICLTARLNGSYDYTRSGRRALLPGFRL